MMALKLLEPIDHNLGIITVLQMYVETPRISKFQITHIYLILILNAMQMLYIHM